MKVKLYIGAKGKEVELPCTEKNVKKAVRLYCNRKHLDVSVISYDLPKKGEMSHEKFNSTSL